MEDRLCMEDSVHRKLGGATWSFYGFSRVGLGESVGS